MVASTPVYLVVFAAVAGWLTHRGLRRLALFVLVTMIGSGLLNLLVKTAVHRARPVLPDPVAHADGVHYVSDILAGYALGAAWLTAMIAAFSAWRRDRGRADLDPARGLEPEHARRLL